MTFTMRVGVGSGESGHAMSNVLVENLERQFTSFMDSISATRSFLLKISFNEESLNRLGQFNFLSTDV